MMYCENDKQLGKQHRNDSDDIEEAHDSSEHDGGGTLETQNDHDIDIEEHCGDLDAQDTNVADRGTSPHRACLSRVVVISVHATFMSLAVIMESVFVYQWTDESPGVVWLSAINQSVVQHLKMMLWPWLLVLFPMDLLARRFWYGRTSTFYERKISKSSWLTLCMSELLGIITAMLIISIFFAIFFYVGSEELIVDVILFLVAVIIGIVVRFYLMGRSERFVAWLAFAYLLLGVLWFFVYFSYSENVYEGYWFNPNLHNLTELEGHDR